MNSYEMRLWRIILAMAVLAWASCGESLASQFVVFPKAGELTSPDGRYVVRNSDRQGAASDFVGTFHTLWLIEASTGRSRKLCDYVGVAAVAWSNSEFLVVTQYAKKNSRALVFSVTGTEEPVMLNAPTLFRLVPSERRVQLRENDHVFVEAARVEQDTLDLRVWGYGQHDPDGFRWRCAYALHEGTVLCTDEGSSR